MGRVGLGQTACVDSDILLFFLVANHHPSLSKAVRPTVYSRGVCSHRIASHHPPLPRRSDRRDIDGQAEDWRGEGDLIQGDHPALASSFRRYHIPYNITSHRSHDQLCNITSTTGTASTQHQYSIHPAASPATRTDPLATASTRPSHSCDHSPTTLTTPTTPPTTPTHPSLSGGEHPPHRTRPARTMQCN